MNSGFYTGVVENRDDPLQLGRCKVRVVGVHTEDKSLLPTADLPWAFPIQPITSAALNGIGVSPVGLVPGTWVIVSFQDESKQFPIIFGSIGGIPQQSLYGQIDIDDGNLLSIPKTDIIELRTVLDQISGSVLKFFDPKGLELNLTSKLRKDMRVSGPGIPDDTLIGQIVDQRTIILTKPFSGLGETILVFRDPPTNLAAVRESNQDDGRILVTGSGTIVTDSSGEPIRTGSSTEATPNDSIPSIPPKGSTNNVAKSREGIRAIIAACDRVGLTRKVQKAALLGIVGGESKWQPVLENTSYDESRFREVFRSIVATRPESEWKTYIRWNASIKGREGFFSYVYGPTARGKGFFGHETDEEAGKYYGRGYIQLTGKSNYQRYQNLAQKIGVNINIVSDPDSLNDNPEIGALVSALFILDRVPANTPLDERYFFVAKNRVGFNATNIAELKKTYFEYFYGESVSSESDKTSITSAPAQTESSAGVDRSGNVIPAPSANESFLGFNDPNGKYPLGPFINEPDTNRLARGVIRGTIVEKKDRTREVGIKTANGSTWDQPFAPYGGQYPYNKVMETESGHVMEWDDTPNNERIGTFHRAGTYSDIDADGTRVDYIIGDSYTIMSKNGFVYVNGECNLTVGGRTNILCQSDVNIKVEGNTTGTFGGNVDLGVAKNMTLAVAEDLSIKVGGKLQVDVTGNTTFKTPENVSFDIGKNFSQRVGADYAIAAAGRLSASSARQTDIASSGGLKISTSSSMDLSGASVAMSASSSMNLKAGSNMRLDYSRGDFGSGASTAASASPKRIEAIEAGKLTFPEIGAPVYNEIPFLEPRERSTEQEIAGETEEDYLTPEGRLLSHELQQNATGVNNEQTAIEEATATGGAAAKAPANCNIIFNTERFTNSYKLSNRFTLGDIVAGGIDGRHRLQNQELRDGNKTRTYTPQEVVCNLANLSQSCLEPIADIMPNGYAGYKKLWMISSGYRLRGVVRNESATSQHCKGFALDITLIGGGNKYRQTFDLIQQIEKVIPYDQLILEYRNPGSCWIHVSFNYSGSNRKMAFTMSNDKTFRRNLAGIPSGFFLLEPVNGTFPRVL